MSEKNRKTALEAAYAYLDTRMRTAAEVSKRLKDKGYSGEEADEAIMELQRMKYLDDYQYALRYYEYNREKRRGSARAARELAEKGVDPETIRNARENFIFEGKIDEFRDAFEAAEKELLLKHRPAAQTGTEEETAPLRIIIDDRAASGICRRLESRGFERSDIFRVLEELRRKYSHDQE